MKNKCFALLLGFFVFLTQANASLDGIYKGCGLGHWVANGYVNGWLAVTTNVTWDLGTTASISYYSTPGACSGPFYAAAQFIDRTYPELEQETVQGEGEHMMAMLNILECGASKQKAVRQGIREDFANVLANEHYAEMPHHEKADSYYRIVAKHASLQCTAS